MKKIEEQSRERFMNEQWDLVTKVSAEFLQANRQELIKWVLDLMTEEGKREIKKILKKEKGEEIVSFIGYFYQKSKDERGKIEQALELVPSKTGIPGIGSRHNVRTYLTLFCNIILLEQVEEKMGRKSKYFKEKPDF
jgi:myosin-crossreactive antigen